MACQKGLCATQPLAGMRHGADTWHAHSQAAALREAQLERLMADLEPHLQSAALAVTAWLSHMDALLVSCRQGLFSLTP